MCALDFIRGFIGIALFSNPLERKRKKKTLFQPIRRINPQVSLDLTLQPSSSLARSRFNPPPGPFPAWPSLFVERATKAQAAAPIPVETLRSTRSLEWRCHHRRLNPAPHVPCSSTRWSPCVRDTKAENHRCSRGR